MAENTIIKRDGGNGVLTKNKGKRYNTGKTKYQLIPPFALNQLAEVYTRGSHKYTVYEDENGLEVLGKDIPVEEVAKRKLTVKDSGDYNWCKGLDWNEAMGSVLRHIEAWKTGEDIDPDLKTYHLGNAAWGLMSLLEFYKIYPQGDSRKQWWKKPLKKVWLDCDGLIADYEKHFLEYFNLPKHHPCDWNDHRFRSHFHKTFNNKDFWLTCPSLIKPEQITYPITGYCTTRPIDNEVIQEWLDINGFPQVEMINVHHTKQKKSEVLKDKCDVFCDDSIYNLIDCQSNGITCFLMTRPHNIKFDVGNMRVNNIEEFFERVKAM